MNKLLFSPAKGTYGTVFDFRLERETVLGLEQIEIMTVMIKTYIFGAK